MQLGFNWTAVPAANIAAFPAAFGSVAFLFFVHFTMPPIEAAMAQPEKFYNASLNAFAISTVITATFGTIGAVRLPLSSLPRASLPPLLNVGPTQQRWVGAERGARTSRCGGCDVHCAAPTQLKSRVSSHHLFLQPAASSGHPPLAQPF